MPETEPKKERKPRMFKVKVHRQNVQPENQDLPITVNPVGAGLGGKRDFMPGQVVELTSTHLEILRNSVVENEIEIPDSSAIYESENPKKMAELNYPGMEAKMDPTTQRITMVKSTPNYVIEMMQ